MHFILQTTSAQNNMQQSDMQIKLIQMFHKTYVQYNYTTVLYSVYKCLWGKIFVGAAS